ncbi:NADP-dependent oxidoreductase domain [Sesbania bispinosa]|nr:NADP-dependent oxidoreductase domain [Sesbania bispinosa]
MTAGNDEKSDPEVTETAGNDKNMAACKMNDESATVESILIERAMHPRFTGENLEKNKLFYKRLDDLASKHACTPSQLALAWLLHQGNDIIPIPGSVTIFIILGRLVCSTCVMSCFLSLLLLILELSLPNG